jgi:hypothetical protein
VRSLAAAVCLSRKHHVLSRRRSASRGSVVLPRDDGLYPGGTGRSLTTTVCIPGERDAPSRRRSVSRGSVTLPRDGGLYLQGAPYSLAKTVCISRERRAPSGRRFVSRGSVALPRDDGLYLGGASRSLGMQGVVPGDQPVVDRRGSFERQPSGGFERWVGRTGDITDYRAKGPWLQRTDQAPGRCGSIQVRSRKAG